MANKENPVRPTPQLKQDALVESLVPDPNNPEPVIQLTGWLGKGRKEGVWRLYLSPQLDEYVEFTDSDVMHTQSVPPAQSQTGGTMVWLRAGTSLAHVQVVRRQVQADFLSGDITSGYMGDTISTFGPVHPKKPVPTNTRGYQCSVNPHIPACQVRTERCGHGSGEVICASGAFCGTGAFVCGPSAGCTNGVECSIGC